MLWARFLESLLVMLPLLDGFFLEMTGGELLRDRFNRGIG